MENDLQVAVSTQIKAIENFYEERSADAQVVCNSPFITQLLEERAEDQQLLTFGRELLRSRVAGNRFIDRIALLDTHFEIVLDSEEKSAPPTIDPEYFGEQLQFTGVVEVPRSDGTRRVIAAVREVRSQDRLLGYLLMELDLQFFEEVRASAGLFNNGTIYLLDRNRELITAGDANASRQHFVLNPEDRKGYLNAWSAQDPDSQQGILYYRAQGDRYISCYSKMQPMDWMMISSINFDEIIQAKRGWIGFCTLIFLELLFLLCAAHIIISRGLGKPVYHMLEKFRQIRETQDYRIRMEERGDSEIGRISKEINLLLGSIEEYIREEKQREKRLLAEAERDPLTGLLNKKAFAKRLTERLSKTDAGDRKTACVYLDVDDFKSFNTQYGHDGGDRVLQFIAERLNAISDGFAGREGGDEFAACLTASGPQELKKTLSSLLESINRGVVLRDGAERVPVHCSIGCARATDTIVAGEDLIKYADEAMYQIKLCQKNGYRIYDVN